MANAPSAPLVSLTQLASAADRAAAERDHAASSPSALRTLTLPSSPSPTMTPPTPVDRLLLCYRNRILSCTYLAPGPLERPQTTWLFHGRLFVHTSVPGAALLSQDGARGTATVTTGQHMDMLEAARSHERTRSTRVVA